MNYSTLLFIDANYGFVTQCLDEERNNRLAQHWPDDLYQLLVEQWHWHGHAIDEVTASSTR